MKHLIFDVNVLLSLWFARPGFKIIEELFEAVENDSELSAWISASSLPILECLAIKLLEIKGMTGNESKKTAKKLVLSLKPTVSVLSNHGFEQLSNYENAVDFEDAQIAIAGSSLNGETIIVSNEKTFDTMGLIKTKSPIETLSWIAQGKNKEIIDFIDLKTQQDILSSQLAQNIHHVLRHGQYVMGSEIGRLEEKLAEYVGVKYCIAVSSGTDALLIAMMALDIRAGDEVITTPFTFIATAEMIALLGAKPVFVDIDPKTCNIDPKKIEQTITPRTKAIMPVSLYGQCADYDAINAIATKHGLPVIEDACQSFGATYKGKKSCNLTTMGCTSFFPSKPLGAYGDAGACFTNDDKLAGIMKTIRVHGQDKRYHHPRMGINGRMDTLQAAILLAKLSIFPEEVQQRETIGTNYTKLISGNDVKIITPYVEPYNTSVYAQYTIYVENREQIQKKLQEAGIPTAIHYPTPLNKQPVLQTNDFDLTVAEDLSNKVMSLPMHPYLSEKEQERIVEAMTARCQEK